MAGHLTPLHFQPRPFAAAVGGFNGKRPKRVLIKIIGE